MKNFKVIGYGLLVMGALLLSAPATAQNPQEWQSTSAMKGAGSSYSSQITAVGATSALSEATTTDSYSPAKAPNGPRKDFGRPGEYGQDEESPIGDAVLPLLALACMYVVYSATRVYRRKRRV